MHQANSPRTKFLKGKVGPKPCDQTHAQSIRIKRQGKQIPVWPKNLQIHLRSDPRKLSVIFAELISCMALIDSSIVFYSKHGFKIHFRAPG